MRLGGPLRESKAISAPPKWLREQGRGRERGRHSWPLTSLVGTQRPVPPCWPRLCCSLPGHTASEERGTCTARHLRIPLRPTPSAVDRACVLPAGGCKSRSRARRVIPLSVFLISCPAPLISRLAFSPSPTALRNPVTRPRFRQALGLILARFLAVKSRPKHPGESPPQPLPKSLAFN